MALVINTNMASLNAQRHLSGSQTKLARSMERLATGKRINTGQDDAAGLGISTRLGGQIRALNQEVRNANDGISSNKAADGALAEVANMLERMRELVSQQGNSALSTADQSAITAEMGSLQGEIDSIKTNTSFNGTTLLSSVSVDGGGASATASTVEGAMDSVAKARGEFGMQITVLESRAANMATMAENLSAARSQILDADIASETAEMTKASVLQQAGVAILAQANQSPQVVLSLLQG
jgi:flagellin